jgi:hypothetical protein
LKTLPGRSTPIVNSPQNRYRRGIGTNTPVIGADLTEAAKYDKLAADQVDIDAHFDQILYPERVEGFSLDLIGTGKYDRPVSDQGHVDAHLDYAVYCASEEGVSMDLTETGKYDKSAVVKYSQRKVCHSHRKLKLGACCFNVRSRVSLTALGRESRCR